MGDTVGETVGEVVGAVVGGHAFVTDFSVMVTAMRMPKLVPWASILLAKEAGFKSSTWCCDSSGPYMHMCFELEEDKGKR